MRHLVADGVGAPFQVILGGTRNKNVVFGEGHHARVFHGANIVFGHECLLIFGVWVGVVEEVLEEVQPVFGDPENIVVVEMRFEGVSAVSNQRHVSTIDGALGAVGVGCGEVFSGKNRGDVGGDTFSGGKNTFGDTRIGGVGYFRFKHPVRADHPFFGGGDPEIEDSFQVGLLKVREDSAAVGGLVLGVEVYALIGGIDVAV